MTAPDASVPVSETLVQQIVAQSGMSVDDVNNVLATLNAVRAGAPVGMVCRDDATGQVAHRVDDQGVVLWRVTSQDGAQWNDMQPTLTWPVIFNPSA